MNSFLSVVWNAKSKSRNEKMHLRRRAAIIHAGDFDDLFPALVSCKCLLQNGILWGVVGLIILEAVSRMLRTCSICCQNHCIGLNNLWLDLYLAALLRILAEMLVISSIGHSKRFTGRDRSSLHLKTEFLHEPRFEYLKEDWKSDVYISITRHKDE